MYGHPYAKDFRFVQLAERRRRRRERFYLLTLGLSVGAALVVLTDFFARVLPF